MSLRLIIEDDEGSTTVVPLASDAITIGRQQGNTIQLTEKNVSRRHARLFPEQDGWVIEDLGSYNGVKVNNETIDGRTKLREGDVVEIGDYHLAITEDVDKSPLNFRSGQAANNDGTAEPMLVSSSADLPRLSPEEIAALQSGQQPITPRPAMMVDSGPVPAGQYHPGYQQQERKSNAGLLIFLGLAFLGAVILGIFFVINSGDDKPSEVASSDGGKTPETKAAADGSEPTPPADDGAAADDAAVVPEAVDDGEVVEDEGDDDGEVIDDGADDGEVVPEASDDEGDDGEVIDDDGGDDGGEPLVVEEDPKQPKPRPKQPKQPKPQPQPKPNVDADALLDEARKVQYTDPATAFRKAKASYQAKPNRDALWVAGFAACRLKDKSKATYVLKRLKGADRTKLKDHCEQKGLIL